MNFQISVSLLLASILYPASSALGHEGEHVDPELLSGWLTWSHLTIQWIHLTAFGLWFGLTAGTFLINAKPSLDQILYSAWFLLVVSLATGNYNIEYSAGISATPSLLSLRLLENIPYGVTYTIMLAIKLGLYALAVVILSITTLFHLCTGIDKAALKKAFLASQSVLIVLITLATATVLFYHEVADLWPTPVHSRGGVISPEGDPMHFLPKESSPPPNDFSLLMSSNAWLDIGARFLHLVGFGIWIGTSAVGVLFPPIMPQRLLLMLWAGLLVQVASGIVNMRLWTPFDVSPYVWNLDHLSQMRFGRSYALFMAGKHILVLLAVALMMAWTVRYWSRPRRSDGPVDVAHRSIAGVTLCIGVVIGYIMIIILLLHEGVDHAL